MTDAVAAMQRIMGVELDVEDDENGAFTTLNHAQDCLELGRPEMTALQLLYQAVRGDELLLVDAGSKEPLRRATMQEVIRAAEELAIQPNIGKEFGLVVVDNRMCYVAHKDRLT